MTSVLKFHWSLPTNGGDGRHVLRGGHGIASEIDGRPADLPYLGQDPHLEGLYRFGEGVPPELARRGRWESPVPSRARAAVPFGG